MSTALALPTTVKGVKTRLALADRLEKKVKKLREQSAEVVKAIGTTAEVNAAAFTFGVIHGKWGEVNVGGVVPASLLAGLGFYALGIMAGDKHGSHAKAIGDGCIASFATLFGVGVGQRLNEGGGTSGLAGNLGADVSFGGPNQGGGMLSDEELAAIADSR